MACEVLVVSPTFGDDVASQENGLTLCLRNLPGLSVIQR